MAAAKEIENIATQPKDKSSKRAFVMKRLDTGSLTLLKGNEARLWTT